MGKPKRSSRRPTTSNEEEFKVINESFLKSWVTEAVKTLEKKHNDEIKALTAQLLQIKNSQEFLCNEFDKLNSECQTLRATNKQQAEEIVQFKAHSAKLEVKGKTEEEKVDALEQYHREQSWDLCFFYFMLMIFLMHLILKLLFLLIILICIYLITIFTFSNLK